MVTITLFYNRFVFVGKKQLQTIKRGLHEHAWKSIWPFLFMKQFVNIRVFKISNITPRNRLVSYSWNSMCTTATTTISSALCCGCGCTSLPSSDISDSYLDDGFESLVPWQMRSSLFVLLSTPHHRSALSFAEFWKKGNIAKYK